MLTAPTSSTTKVPQVSLGLDIGGTKVHGIALDADGRVLASETVPTVPGEDNVIATAQDVVGELLRAAGLETEEAAGIGVGIPGLIDTRSGRVKNAVNLDVTKLDLGKRLSASTQLPVYVHNDVNAAALGAAYAMGADGHVAYLNLGTGLAAALVIDGELQSGATGAAGEIGHLPVDPNGLRCKCGQRGCLETFASGGAIERLWPSKEQHPSDALLAAHQAGDAEATAVFLALADGVAQLIRALFLAHDPDVVVVGGGLRRLGEPLFEQIEATIRQWETESPFLRSLGMWERTQIMPADIPAGAIGAALIGRG